MGAKARAKRASEDAPYRWWAGALVLWLAPAYWLCVQYGGGGVWHRGMGVWVGIGLGALGLGISTQALRGAVPAMQGGRFIGWLAAWFALSAAIAGVFVMFMFGLSDADLRAIYPGRGLSGGGLWVVAALSTAVWSSAISLALLLLSRFALWAVALFAPSAADVRAHSKAWALATSLGMVWLVVLWFAFVPLEV